MNFKLIGGQYRYRCRRSYETIQSIQKDLDAELDFSKKWASQNYSVLKKRLAERKVAGVIEN